jgi:hypothetical protein
MRKREYVLQKRRYVSVVCELIFSFKIGDSVKKVKAFYIVRNTQTRIAHNITLHSELFLEG